MDINQRLEQIIALYDSGGDPNKLMQSMFINNSNIQQIGVQYRNMMQGRTQKDAFLQMAKQQGVTDKNIQNFCRILGWN